MSSPLAEESAGSEPDSIRWGIGSYTYGWGTGTYGASYASPRDTFLDLATLLERAISAKARVLQVVLRPDLTIVGAEELAAVSGRAAAGGVEIETGTVGTDPSHLEEYLALSERLGARTIRTIIRGEGATLERAGNELAEVLPAFERAGVRLAIENFEAFSSGEHARLIEGLASPAVGSCIDTVNNLGRGEGTHEVLAALLPSVVSLHLKDFVSMRSKADSGFEITGCPLGEGRLPVREVVAAVHAARPDASVILEQWIPYQGTREQTIAVEEEWARQSIRYLAVLADDAAALVGEDAEADAAGELDEGNPRPRRRHGGKE